MNVTQLLIAAIAVWQAVEIWHHSELFASWRARLELSDGFFARLLLCPFCLAPWVAVVIVSSLTLADELPRLLAAPIYIIVAALAVARMSNLFNDVVHPYTRTPRYDKLGDIDEEDDDMQGARDADFLKEDCERAAEIVDDLAKESESEDPD